MPSKEADVLIGRRSLAKGYVGQALDSFRRNADIVDADDWTQLRDALPESGPAA